MEEEWEEACILIPKFSCKCSVPKWVGWAVAVAADAEAASKVLAVDFPAEDSQAAPVAEDNEAHRKVSLEAFHFNENAQRRITIPLSARMKFHGPGNSTRTKCSRVPTSRMAIYGGYAIWEWGSYSLASSFPLISWLSLQSWAQECIFASKLLCMCVGD